MTYCKTTDERPLQYCGSTKFRKFAKLKCVEFIVELALSFQGEKLNFENRTINKGATRHFCEATFLGTKPRN